MAGVHDVDLMTTIAAKVDALAHKVDGMALSQPTQFSTAGPSTDILGHELMEQVDYLGNPVRPQNNPYSNTYNPGWRNHPNFSWSNPAYRGGNAPAPGFQRPLVPSAQPPQEKKPSLEELLSKFIQTS